MFPRRLFHVLLTNVVGLVAFPVFESLARASAASLPRSYPEAQGISSAGILAFVEAADQKVNTMNSFMLVRHGHVVAEGWWTPYTAETPHALYSLSKSFTSTAVGLAIAESKLSLDDEVLKFFSEDAPTEASANLKAMRVHDLLRMSAGHQTEASLSPSASQPWTRLFLAHPVLNKPGTHFLYNTPATYMLSAIVQKATGSSVLDYLRPRLFEPLGIDDPIWETSPQGITLGGYGLSIRTEDIAKFGQLYLQKGNWGGRQLVPVAWVEAATARQTSNGSNPKSDWDQGYGYQFWRCRNGAYRGDGAFGQFCIVLPEHDAVVAITSGTKDMQAVMNLVWDKLLPTFQAKPLPANDGDRAKLQHTLAHLTLPFLPGSASSSLAGSISGKRFVFPENDQKLEAIALESGSSGKATTLVLRVNGVDQRIVSPHDMWQKARLAYGKLPERPVAVNGAWITDQTYAAKLCFYETPTTITIKLNFSGKQVEFDSEFNVAFGPTQPPRLIGQAQDRTDKN